MFTGVDFKLSMGLHRSSRCHWASSRSRNDGKMTESDGLRSSWVNIRMNGKVESG